ncbi:RES domain-containing protein [Anaerocolumna sp. AGMB13020]|uniref:RES domain-containing protein n=1 Tax=Anaerocolumna sp. AGMB13020 TaxID=3081750 RepID=UPI00295415E6|nr:RES domain-containing protein [Anaerocolumna sp. AGMB13020]WOO35807.1 RES domain-containing protein [Anaerocolumna sp. AGMB13020]
MFSKRCCIKCFDEIEIQSFIKELDKISDCDYCGSKQIYCGSLEDVGNFIREGIERAYEAVYIGTGSMYDSETKSYTNEGDNIASILKWDLCIFSDNLNSEQTDCLCDDLISNSGPSLRAIQKGADNWIVNQNLVVKDALYGYETTAQHNYWEEFKESCKHFNRFFDLGGRRSSRAKILSSLDDIFTSMKITLPKGTQVYRGRRFEIPNGKTLSDIDLLKEISPPPPNSARNSRMSPAGISYTYLASNIDTCLAEIHVQSNDNALIGEFVTKKVLKILDLSSTSTYTVNSCFSPAYDHSQNWIGDFVNHFKNEISAPISEDEQALEYVATQLLAEYIRKNRYDGIRFRSSLNASGLNYVLFCSVNRDITHVMEEQHYGVHHQIIPFTKWLNLTSVQYINCPISYNIIEQISHDDRAAKYHNWEEGQQAKVIEQFWINGKTEFWD